MKKRLVLFSVFLLLTAPWAGAAEPEWVLETGPSPNRLVILFTNDANASCNAALEWMSAQKGNPDLWRTFVPVALHVSQWDTGGFRDTFAKSEFDAMLDAYGRSWKSPKTYPPTMVADDADWPGWAREQDIPRASEKPAGVLSVRRKKEEWDTFTARFKPAQTAAKGPFTLHVAVLSFGAVSRPFEGRNRGKELTHDFLAVLYRKQDMLYGSDAFTADVVIKSPKFSNSKGYGLAFWVTKQGGFLPLQAVGGPFPHEK